MMSFINYAMLALILNTSAIRCQSTTHFRDDTPDTCVCQTEHAMSSFFAHVTNPMRQLERKMDDLFADRMDELFRRVTEINTNRGAGRKKLDKSNTIHDSSLLELLADKLMNRLGDIERRLDIKPPEKGTLSHRMDIMFENITETENQNVAQIRLLQNENQQMLSLLRDMQKSMDSILNRSLANADDLHVKTEQLEIKPDKVWSTLDSKMDKLLYKMEENKEKMELKINQLENKVEMLFCVAGKCCDIVYEKSCYQVIRTAMAWQQASDHCESKGGQLADIENASEDKRLLPLATDLMVNLWIDGRRRTNENIWMWSTKAKIIGYQNWHLREPSGWPGKTELCLQMAFRFGATTAWDDTRCDIKQYSLCKFRWN